MPPIPPIDGLNVWPLVSGASKVSPRAAKPLPIGSNCLVLGDWKLITGKTSPDFWQGPSFALSTLRYPFAWRKGVLNGCSSTRVSLWDSLMFGRLAMGFTNVRAGTRVLKGYSYCCSGAHMRPTYVYPPEYPPGH